MVLPFEKKIRNNLIYCCLVAIVFVVLFTIFGIGFGYVVSWLVTQNIIIEISKKLPSWTGFAFPAFGLFLLSNLCLYYSEIIVESFVDKLSLSRIGAFILLFFSVIFCFLCVYFGFSSYIIWLFG